MRFLLSVLLTGLLLPACAVEWKNVDADHYRGGRRASVGYLQGKVVLVARWGAKNDASCEVLSRLEELWENFKSKQFVLLGGHVGGWGGSEAVKAVVAEKKLSFPVYEDAQLAAGEPPHEDIPFLYVVDETGKVVYFGKDDRTAVQAVVTAITDLDSPKNVKQWRHFLDYEFENLPAHAYNRLNEFRKKYPDEAKDYFARARELVRIADVKKVAELVEFAKRAKDVPKLDKAKRAKYESLVTGVLESCAPLKGVADPRLAQEAKNALADLKWTEATF